MAISIETALGEMGYKVADSEVMFSKIDEWKAMFQGDIKGFHKYQEWNGKRVVDKQRKSLGMPKKCCEDWADNIYNDNVHIQIGNEFQDVLAKVLQLNKFRRKFSETLEYSFALGTGGLVEYKDRQKNARINYYKAYCIRPLEVINNEIVSCAFASFKADKIVHLNVHDRQIDGTYLIKNRVFEQKSDKSIVEVDSDLSKEERSPVKLFQIIKPVITNNIELDSGMGMSCFANAEDENKVVDTIFDSFDNEIAIGKKRVYAKSGAVNINITADENGNNLAVPVFDHNQTIFYEVSGEDDEGTIIQETQEELRIPSLTEALQTALNLYGRKVGLGDDYYSFKDGTVYTNTTQVISSNSAFYKTLKKHEKAVLEVIQELVTAIYYLTHNKISNFDVTVDFDDSIIEDTAEIKRQAMLEYNSGLIDSVQYYQDVYKMTEEQAIQFDKSIRERLKANLEEDTILGEE